MNELDRKGPMTEMTAAQSRNLHVGIDIGSTTVKAVVLDADTNEELFGVYRRHGSQQIQATLRVLDEIVARFPFAHIRCALCGSGSEDIARGIGALLGLNCELIEAIALGHDVGHTPFGHAGERFLDKCYHARTGRYGGSRAVSAGELHYRAWRARREDDFLPSR